MTGTLILLLFFILMFLGIPVAFSLCLAALFYIVLFVDVPPIIIVQQILSGVDKFTLMAIPFFVIAGTLMEHGGISKRIVNFAKAVVAPLPGGLSIVVVISSIIFAAMSGAGAATTAAVGSIMIPAMIKDGYDPDYSCALQASAGIFGPLIPPSILMVLYGVTAGVSVGDMLVSGVIPGLLMGVMVLLVAVIYAIKNGHKGTAGYDLKNVFVSFIEAFWAILTPVIILGGIYTGLFTPTEAAAVAAFYSLIVGVFVYKELKWNKLLRLLAKSFILAAGIMLIVGATQSFGWVLTKEGIPQDVAAWFGALTDSPLIFLFSVCCMLLVAGCFIDAVPALMIFAPILCPAAKEFGIPLMHFGVVMVVSLCIGLVTPPVGLNLFVASTVGGRPVHKIIPYVPPFLIVMIAGLGILVLFPGLSTYLPALMRR